MKVLCLTRYNYDGPSSRYRFYQYAEILNNYSVEYTFSPFFQDSYLDNLKKNKLFNLLWFPLCVLRRFYFVLISWRFDLIFIEKELIPFFPAFAERILLAFNIKYVLDFDDAIFHNYDLSKQSFVKLFLENKIPFIVTRANGVISGSPYLTKYLSKFNPNVIEIPTSIDLNRYQCDINKYSVRNDSFTIGWIGSFSTCIYVKNIFPALGAFCQKYSNVRVCLIGFDVHHLDVTSEFAKKVNIVKWSSANEVRDLMKIDVGIMPLDETPWEQGKCGFKLIQYMACCLPTISTPLEANVKINGPLTNLFATSIDDWFNCFEEIYLNRISYENLGVLNRKRVEEFYSIQANANVYSAFFNKIIS